MGKQEVEKPDLEAVVKALVPRISAIQTNVETESSRAMEIKETVVQKAEGYGKVERVRSVFRKYDKAKNGLLFKRNVLAYAAGEFNFEIPADVFNSFWDLHSEHSQKHGEKGVAWEQFHDLKVSIGIARELKRDRKKRELRQANEEPVAEAAEVPEAAEAAEDEPDAKKARTEEMTEEEKFRLVL